jgi:cytochrome o ubiquinol oxidase subunit IV
VDRERRAGPEAVWDAFTARTKATLIYRRTGNLSIFFGAVVTFLLGAAFLNLELREFQGMIAMGAVPQRSAFLSAFFTLVGCHGLHVAVGLAWLVLMMVQLSLRGFSRCCGAPLGLLLPVLARARHHLGPDLHNRLSDGSPSMTEMRWDVAPGDRPTIPASERSASSGLLVYAIGLFLAAILTITSFWVANTSVIWAPGVPAGLAVLAIAQMGVHLVFFLHITTGPDSTNNVLALAFGVLIVFLVLAGSLVIMANLNENMMAMAANKEGRRAQCQSTSYSLSD